MNRFDRFTEPFRKALALAQEEATRFNHTDVGNDCGERRRAW